MALSHGRVVAVGETLYPHEQEGIDFAIQALPDTHPYHLWALIDLLDKSTGRYVEIDLLILGYSCLYLVELKAWPGRIEGDSIDWTWTAPEGRSQWKENPLRLTRRKAQILKSRLERAMPPGVRAPWIEPLVLLSDKDVKLGLTPDGILGVLRRDDFVAAITRHEFRGADPRHQGQRIDGRTTKDVVKALGELGFRQRKGKLHVGPYELGELLDETDAYQDRVATHRDLKLGKKSLQRRARTYLVPEQTSIERRQQLRRAADREAQLLYEVSQHPNILTYAEYITDAPLGPTVLLESTVERQREGARLLENERAERWRAVRESRHPTCPYDSTPLDVEQARLVCPLPRLPDPAEARRIAEDTDAARQKLLDELQLNEGRLSS